MSESYHLQFNIAWHFVETLDHCKSSNRKASVYLIETLPGSFEMSNVMNEYI